MTTHVTNVMFYTVRSGDTLTGIAAKFGTTVEQLVKWNKIANPDVIKTGQRLTVSQSDSPQALRYTVRKGDTLTAIAAKFGTTVEQLVKWNKIANPDRINIGQQLIVAKSQPASV